MKNIKSMDLNLLKALDALSSLDALAPAPTISPMALLRTQKAEPKRAPRSLGSERAMEGANVAGAWERVATELVESRYGALVGYATMLTGSRPDAEDIVHDALMIEPTETESKEAMDAFAETLATIAAEARTQPELLHAAPHLTPVTRLDEVKAVIDPRL